MDRLDQDRQRLVAARVRVAERLAECRAAGFWIDTPSPQPTPGEVAARATLDVLTAELVTLARILGLEDAS